MRVGLLLFISIFALSAAVPAQQITYLQGGVPAFSITYPVGWEIRTPRSEERNVMSAYPADGSLLWQGLWIMRETTSVDEAVARLQAMELGLLEDAALTQEPWTERIGNLDVRCYKGRGLYQGDKPVETFMALFQLPDQQIGALGYIGEAASIEARSQDLHTILYSLEVAQ